MSSSSLSTPGSAPGEDAKANAPSSASSSIATYSTWSEHQANKKKKSDDLIPFPIFSVLWLAYSLSPSPSSSSPSSPSGLLLFGGGGGKKGTGVESGVVVCAPHPSASPSSPVELSPVGFLSTHDAIVMHMQPHPLYRELALAMGDGTAVVRCDLSSHRMLPVHSAQTDWSKERSSQAQAISPAGDLLATGGEDRVIRLWRYSDMALLAMAGTEAERHRDMILTLDFNSDGSILASCGGDSAVKLWDTSALLTNADSAASAASAPADGIVSRVAPLVHSITVPTEQGQTAKFQVCRFVGGPRLPMADVTEADGEGEADAADGKSGEGLRRRRAAAGSAPASTASSPPDTSSDNPVPEQLIAIANLASRTRPSNRLLSVYLPRQSPASGTSSSAALAPISAAHCRQLWSVPCGKAQLIQMAVHPSSPTATIAVASNDGAVHLYACSLTPSFPPQRLHTAQRAHDLPATGFAFSPDGRWLCSASADRTFRFFDVAGLRVKAVGAMGGAEMAAMAGLLLLFLLIMAGVALWVLYLDDADRAGVEDLLRLWLTGDRTHTPQQQMRRRG